MAKKNKKNQTVEVGTTVELDVNTDSKTQKTNKMSKKEKGAKATVENGTVELITAIVQPSVKRDELYALIEEHDDFKKDRKELLEEKNPMVLKKQMLDRFDQEQVKEIRASVPKPERKPKDEKAPKVNPLVKEIEDAEDVDELKAIAKSNDEFNWKELKGLKKVKKIRKAMLELVPATKAKAKKEPAAPKMIPNPLIEEINEFKKLKKLVKWAKESEQVETNELPKKLKKYDDLDDLKAALISSIPAEIEKVTKIVRVQKPLGSTGLSQVDFIRKMIKERKNRKKLVKKLAEEFGQSEAWANGRYKLHENKYGEMGKTDPKQER